MNELQIEQRRGSACEALHDVDAVLVSSAGELLAQAGAPCVTTFRSAAKPFQLAACLSLLADGTRAALTDVDLALGAASHHGEPGHLALLADLHRRHGLSLAQLFCGAHLPLHEPSAHALLRAGGEATALHNNCAGKHSFMALASVAQGAAPDYRPIDHPVQQAIAAQLDALTEGGVEDTVLDGCGVPCFVMSIDVMALAWARLANAVARGEGELGSVGKAMQAYPCLMSGTHAFDGWLTGKGRVLAKVGAAGLLCVAVPSMSVGVAIKVRSGADLVRPLAALTILRDWLGELVPDRLPAVFVEVRNVVGDLAGELVAVCD